MPVYVPNCRHDIFISYAHVDNIPFSGAEKGWVTTLVSGLKILLGKKLGRPDAFSLWMDYELRGNTSVTPDINEQLDGCATLVLILSPGYLASQWCRLELSTFLAKVGQGSGRVFMVEHDYVERPAELSDLLGYRFWVTNEAGKPRILGLPKPNPEEFEYYQKLDDLARQLTDKLKELKTQAEMIVTRGTIPSPAVDPIVTTPVSISAIKMSASGFSPSETTLFLAEVTADLEERRNEVKRYLDQQCVRILPERAYSFASIQQSMDQDLSECYLFVQLLSDKVGNGYPQFQHERAVAAHLPILQWRDPALDLAAIPDSTYRAFLEGSTIVANNIIEFQSLIIKQLQPEPEAKNPEKWIDEDALVFVNAAPEDMALAYQIKDLLEAHGIGYSLPLDISITTKAAEIRQYLEHNLLSCDSVIVLYDNTSVVWVNEQLLYCRRMQRRRDHPLKIIAVYSTPSGNKSPLNVKLPNMQVLECPTPQVDTCLPLFFQSLQS